MKVSVLGCGRWGTFLAWHASTVEHEVILWGREDSANFKRLESEGRNEYLALPEQVKLCSSLEQALESDYIIVSISSQNLREFTREINYHAPVGKNFILCMKGIEANTGKRLLRCSMKSLPILPRLPSGWVPVMCRTL